MITDEEWYDPLPVPNRSKVAYVSVLNGEGAIEKNPLLGPNWPPGGWTTATCPVELSVEAIVQWLDEISGPRGVLDVEQQMNLNTEFSSYVQDAWRLVRYLRASGIAQILSNAYESDAFLPDVRMSLEQARAQLIQLKHAIGVHGGPEPSPLPSSASSSFEGLQSDAYSPGLTKLLEFGVQGLKGKERRLIELLCYHGGSIPLADLARDRAIAWKPPWDDMFNSTRKRINTKLKAKQVPYWIVRQNNAAKVKFLGRK
jgi:hypothetical protein